MDLHYYRPISRNLARTLFRISTVGLAYDKGNLSTEFYLTIRNKLTYLLKSPSAGLRPLTSDFLFQGGIQCLTSTQLAHSCSRRVKPLFFPLSRAPKQTSNSLPVSFAVKL